MLEILTAGAKAPVVTGNIKKVDAGTNAVVVLSNSGNLYAIGDQYFSGTGGTVTSWTKTADNVVDFCCGYRQVLIRKSDGTYWFMGVNNVFPTTLGATLTTFTNVTSYLSGPLTGKTIKKMVLSQTSLAILCIDGTVVMSGSNANGGMGVGNTSAYRTPTLRSDITNIQDIGFDFSITDTTYYLSNDGQLYGSGNSTSGQLGTTSNVSSFRLIVSNSGQTVTSIHPAISGIVFFRRLSAGTGNISVLGQHFNGSLGTGSTSNTTYSTPQNVASIGIGVVDPTIVTGTYHTRYWIVPNNIFYTGATGSFIGAGSFNSPTKYSFTSQGTSPFNWESYAQTRDNYTASYVISNGKLYGAGTGLLSGFSTAQPTYIPLDTSIII